MPRVTHPADPRRCQATYASGQCLNLAVEGSANCESHGWAGNVQEAEENARRLYHLTDARYRQRLADLDEHDHLRTLRELIAIATRLINTRFNLISDDPADLSETCGPWDDLLLTKDRLVKSAHQIEQNLGVLIGKPSVIRLGQLIVQIIAEQLQGIPDYTNVVGKIAQQTMQAITSANNACEITTIELPTLVAVGDTPTFRFDDLQENLRIADLSRHERIKSVSEDISLQVIMIERRRNAIKNDIDLKRACPQLCQMFKTLDKLIKTAYEIEQTLGYLLDKDTLRRLGQKISEILIDQLEKLPNYETLIDTIMHKVIQTITNEKRRIDEQKALPAPQ